MTFVRFPHAPATDPDPRPKVHHVYRRRAPKKAPCPSCGRLGRRKDRHERTVRSIAYQAILLIHVTTAEYRATCDCCTTFRTQVEGIAPKAHYDNKVRDAVLDRILDDRMSLRQIQHALQRDFFLDLSDGFLYDCLDGKIRQLDGAAYRQWTLAHFSGTLYYYPPTPSFLTKEFHAACVNLAVSASRDAIRAAIAVRPLGLRR
jgi:hypothetical protein